MNDHVANNIPIPSTASAGDDMREVVKTAIDDLIENIGTLYHRAAREFDLPCNTGEGIYNAKAEDGKRWSYPFSLSEVQDYIRENATKIIAALKPASTAENCEHVRDYPCPICDAKAAPVADSGWRDISTAPRDGTPFLCFHPADGFSDQSGIDLIWYEPSIKTYTMDGDNEVPFAGITHWRSLPAPPSRTDETAKGGA